MTGKNEKGISKDLRKVLHNALCNYAKLYMKNLGYNFYELKNAIPDLIATDRFGNIIILEALTRPTAKVMEETIVGYRRQGAKRNFRTGKELWCHLNSSKKKVYMFTE